MDIEADEALHALYLERIPVVQVNGDIVSELHIDLARLRLSLDTVTP